jgi:hypothetical protein
LLLFTALRNEFLRRGDLDRAKVIERQYILTSDLRSREETPKLRLNDEDMMSLEAVIQANPDSEEMSKSRLGSALRFFEGRVQEEAKNAGSHWAETLFQWIEFIEHRARVICVEVSDESDAFLIFETLNARGRELTVADLLKNYLFGLARDDLDTLQDSWLAALESLETSADEELFTTFVRHLWGSLHGATRERELYARMKASITSSDRALEFGGELESAAPFYAALLSADQPFWWVHVELQPTAETLFRLGLEQNRTLLLAAMRAFEPEELDRLLRAVISWSVRGLIAGGIGGGTTERAYGEAAVAVSERRATSVEDVFQELSAIIPTDEVFEESFANRRINRSRISKYLLVALTQAEGDNSDPMLVSDSVDARHQLGLVLPRRPDPAEWPGFPADEIGQWALRLGNQYVVGDGAAPSLSNTGPDAWSPSDVVERQRKLAQAAVQLWPRRP